MSVAPRPLVPGAGRRPIKSREDVLAQFPAEIREPEFAEVRDRLADALGSLVLEYERRSEISAAQADLLRATRIYLSALGTDFNSPRQPGEEDEDYRTRVLYPGAVATEPAIVAGVNAILSLVTDKQCRLIDAVLDQAFLRSAAPMFVGLGPQAVGSGTQLTVTVPSVPEGSQLIMQVSQANGTVGDVPGWSLLDTLSYGFTHTVLVRTSTGDETSVTVPIVGLTAGDAQARVSAYAGAVGEPLQRVTGDGQLVPAPVLAPEALMVSLIAASTNSPLVNGFGDWTRYSSDASHPTLMVAQGAYSSPTPSGTPAQFATSLVAWSMFSFPIYPAGGRYAWQSFFGRTARSPTRFYETDAPINDGVSLPNRTPTGMHIFSGPVGRKFLLLLPDLLALDVENSYVSSAASPLWDGSAMWLASAANFDQGEGYIRAFSDSAINVYRAIESFVDGIVGQSIRWCAIGNL